MAKAIFSDNFERLVLKECYVDKYTHQDVKSANKYRAHSDQTAYIMYQRLKYKFDRVGYDLDDIKSIAFYYTLHYFGLYSIQNNPKEKAKYDKRKVKQSIFITERNKLISFLRQRIIVLGEYCDRKSRNIIAGKDYRMWFAHTENSIPASDYEIINRYKELGYRKVIAKEVKQIMKDNSDKTDLRDKSGFSIIQINHIDQGLSPESYKEITEGNSSLFYRGLQNPIDVLVDKEESNKFQVFVNRFKSMDKKKKVKTLKFFVSKYKYNSKYTEEVKLANRLLRNKTLLENY